MNRNRWKHSLSGPKNKKNNAPFGFKVPEDSPGFMLWQMTVAWQDAIRQALKPYNISHIQHVILAILLWFEKSEEAPTQISLSRMANLDKMTVSKALRSLEERGYVKRYESETDSRAKQMELTPRGRELATILVPLVEKTDETFFAPLQGDIRKVFIRNMKVLGKKF